jgi:hypothetical protein
MGHCQLVGLFSQALSRAESFHPEGKRITAEYAEYAD